MLELYDLNTDFSQSQNIAQQHPDKVKAMNKMFIEEAKKYQEALTPGKHTIEFDFNYEGLGAGTLTGVNDADYKPPFALTAKLNKLTLKVDRPVLSEADKQKLMAAQKNNKSSE